MRLQKTKSTLLALLAVNCHFSLPVANAQTTSEIESIVKSSNGVDKSRPIKAFVKGGLITISTYCDPHASDQDCKINSLFILKKLKQQYKSIHYLRISFFNPRNMSGFRTVDVTERDVSSVDSGKPVQDVLSRIAISRGILPPSPATKAAEAAKEKEAKRQAYLDIQNKNAANIAKAAADFKKSVKQTSDTIQDVEQNIRSVLH